MNKSKAVKKLILSSPLIPPIFCVLMFIGILSPVTWSVKNYLPVVFMVAIGISVVSAYCITSFLEDFRNK